MKRFLAAFSLTLAASTGALAQAPTAPMADDFLDRLAGHWVMEGTILKRATVHDVTAEWVLAHQYLRIHEVSRERNDKGEPRYEAIVFVALDRANAGYTCLWLDTTTGDGLTADGTGRAKRTGDSIPFLFRGKDGKPSFSNTFAYDRATDTWRWEMDNVSDGKALPFGRLTLRREARAT